MTRARSAAVAGALFLLALSAYRGALDNGLIYDDPILIESQLPYFDDLANTFFPPPTIPEFADRYYRPLVLLSYRLDEALTRALWSPGERSQRRRLVFHTTPVLLHGVVTALVFLLGLSLQRWLGSGEPGVYGAVLGATLFAVHPIHVESVAWIAGRTDPLCALFYLLALLAWLRYRTHGESRQRAWAAGLAALAGFAAMLAKEVGVSLLLMIPALDVAWQLRAHARTGARASALALAGPWLVLAGLGLGYWALREAALHVDGLPPAGTGSGLAALFGSLAWYLGKLVWPAPQSAFVAELPGACAAFAGVGLASAAAALLLAALRERARSWLAEAFSGVLLLATLAPSLAIAWFRISEAPLAERYLYLPSIGACLLTGLLAERLLRSVRRRELRLVAGFLLPGVVAGLALWATVQRTEVWSDDRTFWLDAVAKAPGASLPRLQLGLSYASARDWERAETEFRAALESAHDADGRAKAYNNLGLVARERGDLKEALARLEQARAERPADPGVHMNLATVLLQLAVGAPPDQRLRLREDAADALERALARNPRFTSAHLLYGRLLGYAGRAHLERVLELAPDSPEAEVARAGLRELDSR